MIYLFAFVINVILSLWVQHDAKNLRATGISITPGLWSTLVFFGSIPLLVVYFIVRILFYAPKAGAINAQSLPPASKYTNWLTLIIIIVVVGGILLSVMVVAIVRQNQYQSVPQQPAPANPQSQPVVTQNSNSESLVYSYGDSHNKFYIQYPSGWNLIEMKPTTPTDDLTVLFKSPDSTAVKPILLSVEAWQSIGPRSAAAQIAQFSNLKYNKPEKSAVTVGTISALKFTDNSTNGSWIIFEKGGYTYTISSRNVDEALFVRFYGSLTFAK